MSTLAPARPVTPPTPGPSENRYAGWRQGWSLAIRMARRDVLRHKGRSLVVMLMVAVPTTLLTFLLVVTGSNSYSSPALLPYRLGSAQALISMIGTTVVTQTGSDQMSVSLGGEKDATPIPGYNPDAAPQDNIAALSAFVEGRVIPQTGVSTWANVGERRVRFEGLVMEPDPALGSLLSLKSGRWPTAPGEIVVTEQALRRGIPATGSLPLTMDRETGNVTIVGVADVWNDGRMPDFLTSTPLPLAPTSDSTGTQWFVVDRGPVDFPTVQKFGQHGIQVMSTMLTRDPVPIDQLPLELQEVGQYQSQNTLIYTAVGGAILVLVTGLLVAPAFAVSAARQRRTLALSASNGATTAHLRRFVVAAALVLGMLAALLGALVGIGAAALFEVLQDRYGTYVSAHPLQIPWLPIAVITACAVAAAFLAALVPTRSLGRLDIVGVMKGQNVSPAPSRTAPVVGVFLMVVGGTAILWGLIQRTNVFYPLAGLIGLTLGGLLLVPMALVALARVAGRLPLPMRMATREAARQRARSVPSVAAIIGAVAGLVTVLISVSSDTAERAKTYQPQTVMGQGVVQLGDPSRDDAVREIVRAKAPTLQTYSILGLGNPMDIEQPGPSESEQVIALVPPSCTPEAAVYDSAHWKRIDDFILANPDTEIPEPTASPCQLDQYRSTGGSGILVLDTDQIAARASLTASQKAVLADGGMLIVGPANLVQGGTARVAVGELTLNPETGGYESGTAQRTVTVPAVTLSDAYLPNIHSSGSMVVMTPEAAKRVGSGTYLMAIGVVDPSGTVSPEMETTITEALGDEGYFYVERGFVRDDALFIAILVGIFTFLLLIITLTSTALSLAEQEKEDGTFAAVGATRGTRRALAAGQAFTTAIIGTVIGAIIGAVPGFAFTYPLTAQSFDPLTGQSIMTDPTIVIPWLWLAAVIIGAPLLAATIAWLGVRRAPVVTRRAS